MRYQSLRDMVNLHRNYTGWYRIENAATETATIHIYGIIGLDVTANQFIQELGAVSAPQLNVHIATDGGDVFDGIAILNALRSHPAEVTTIVDSQALSAGSFILQAGGTRKMMPNSTVMVHDAMSAVFGNAEELTAVVDRLGKASDNIASIYAERAGGTVEQWRTVMKAETWFSANEAVAAGLADEVIQLPTNKSTQNTFKPEIKRTPNAENELTAEPFDFSPELFRQALQEAFK